MKSIYLDNHATTSVDPRILEVMLPWFTKQFGNSSSRSHPYGWQAEEAVEVAREQVANLINANSYEIIFTSGATEANNWVVKGVCKNTLTSTIEHKSILQPCDFIKSKGILLKKVRVDNSGTIDISDFFDKLDADIKFVTIMMANNEVGSIQPIEEIGDAIRLKDILFHSDISQAVGKINIDVNKLGINSASLSAHKMYGPKGIGALYINENLKHKISTLIHGGGQEFGMRAGTLNVPAIVGFGKMCEILKMEMDEDSKRILKLKNMMEEKLTNAIPEIKVHKSSNRLPGNLHLYLPCNNIDLFMSLLAEKVSVSFGSACMSSSIHKSHVLKAMGVNQDEINKSIRIGIGKFNTEEEIKKATEEIIWTFNIVNSAKDI